MVKSSFTDLLTFADNTCLLDVSLHRIIISIHFPLIYAIWWPLTHITQSYLCMNGWQRRASSFSTHTHTHTHTEACVSSQWGEQHAQNFSESHFMSVSPFHLSKSVSYPHIIYTQKCKRYSRQPIKIKVCIFEDSAAEWSHNISNMF